jgi:hypothetical protein
MAPFISKAKAAANAAAKSATARVVTNPQNNINNRVPPNHTERKEIRYKSVIIPKIGDKYVVVTDKKSGDFTFMMGGCGKTEHKINCARRELLEESRKSMNKNIVNSNHAFLFSSKVRSGSELRKNKNVNKVQVTTVYNVFVYNTDADFNIIKSNFNSKRRMTNIEKRNLAFLETTGIHLMSKAELMESPRVWSFLKRRIVPHLH